MLRKRLGSCKWSSAFGYEWPDIVFSYLLRRGLRPMGDFIVSFGYVSYSFFFHSTIPLIHRTGQTKSIWLVWLEWDYWGETLGKYNWSRWSKSCFWCPGILYRSWKVPRIRINMGPMNRLEFLNILRKNGSGLDNRALHSWYLDIPEIRDTYWLNLLTKFLFVRNDLLSGSQNIVGSYQIYDLGRISDHKRRYYEST